jgi:hypothetical protein
MSLTKFPNGISSMGVPVVGGAVLTSGSVFFVDSATGSDSNSGADTSNPVATIDYAIGLCTANKGDVIFVMPAYAQTLTTSAGITCDVEGISIIGLGNGDNRPTISTGASQGSEIDITADNVVIRNMRFDFTSPDAMAPGINLDAAYCTIDGCEIIMADTGGQATNAVDVGASSHGFTFINNRVVAPNAGATEAIVLGDTAGATNDIVIRDNYFNGDFSVAVITNTAAAACLRVDITGNEIVNTATGKDGISIGATTVGVTGVIAHNLIGLTGTAGGTMIAKTGQCRLFRNYLGTLATAQGELLPAEDGVST